MPLALGLEELQINKNEGFKVVQVKLRVQKILGQIALEFCCP